MISFIYEYVVMHKNEGKTLFANVLNLYMGSKMFKKTPRLHEKTLHASKLIMSVRDAS